MIYQVMVWLSVPCSVLRKVLKSTPLPKPLRQGYLESYFNWYRLTSHSTTGIAPAQLLLGRIPHSQLDLLKPELSDKIHERQQSQNNYHD